MAHLTADQLGKLRAGALSGAELLSADDHLAVCEECRARLATLPSAVSGWGELAGGMRAASAAAEPHLSFERLQAYIDDTCGEDDRRRVEAHLAQCELCRGEADDLREFAAAFHSRRSGAVRYARYLIFGPIAAVLFIGALLIRQPHPGPPPLALSLHDSGKIIGLDQQGRLAGAGAASGADRDLLTAALHGSIAVTVPEGLRSSRSVLLGTPAAEARFRVLAPAGEPVVSDTPEFRWEPIDQARGYTVQVFDADYQPVSSSPQITATSWTPSQHLERGKLYVWQVTAIVGASQIKAPQPPEPEARFLVIPGAQAASIDQARQAQAGHLELSALYARAGLCREALPEIDALQRENPASALVQQIRSNLSSQCDGAAQR